MKDEPLTIDENERNVIVGHRLYYVMYSSI